jgi:hypothetical protein
MRSPLDLQIPGDWGLASFSLFFEREDLRNDTNPFAASFVVQLRMEVPKDAVPSAVRDRDLAQAQQRIPGLSLIGKGILAVPSAGEADYMEWMFPDPAVDTIHQLVLYVRPGTRLYTLTATHRHERFEAIRADILDLVARVKKSIVSQSERGS